MHGLSHQSKFCLLHLMADVDEFSNLKSIVILSVNSLPELIKTQGRRHFLVIIVILYHGFLLSFVFVEIKGQLK